MRYEINKSNYGISIYEDGKEEPFWFQPTYPNGDTFDTYEEAEVWTKLAIKSRDESYGFYAPDGKELSGIAKPTESEKLYSRLARTGLSVDDLKQLLGM